MARCPVMLFWMAQAFAAPTVHVTVTDAAGAVILDDEGALPYAESATAGKTGVYVYVSSYDRTRGLIEVGAGKARKGEVKVKVTTSAEMDAYAPVERDIVWKDRTFRVRAVFGDPVAPPEVVPAPETPSRYVRVWDDAALLASPRNPVSTVRERELPGGRMNAAEEASPMKVVASWGETHLEVETVPAPGPEHCYGTGGPPTEAWPLQFYVARADAVDVVVNPLSASFPDGTGYTVSPGVAVLDGDSGRVGVMSAGLWFEIEVSEGDLGSIYALGERRPPADTGLSIAAGTEFDTAFGKVTWDGDAPLPVSGIEGLEHPIATLRAGCLEVRVPYKP